MAKCNYFENIFSDFRAITPTAILVAKAITLIFNYL